MIDLIVTEHIEKVKESFDLLKPGAFAFLILSNKQKEFYRSISQLEAVGYRTDFTSIYLGAKDYTKIVAVVMKPLSEKTFLDQALKNGKGVTWLDNCRIPYKDAKDYKTLVNNFKCLERFNAETKENWSLHGGGWKLGTGVNLPSENDGRFPANLLIVEDKLNNGVITKSPVDSDVKRKPRAGNVFTGESCGFKTDVDIVNGYGDSGSYSRYFDLDKWYTFSANASADEKLKTYLIMLGSAPDEIVICDDEELVIRLNRKGK